MYKDKVESFSLNLSKIKFGVKKNWKRKKKKNLIWKKNCCLKRKKKKNKEKLSTFQGKILNLVQLCVYKKKNIKRLVLCKKNKNLMKKLAQINWSSSNWLVGTSTYLIQCE